MIEQRKPVPEQPKPIVRPEAAAARQVEKATVARETSAKQKKPEATNTSALSGLKESKVPTAAQKETAASRQAEARAARPENSANNKKSESSAVQPREGLKGKPESSSQLKKQETAADARTTAAQKGKTEGGGRIASSDQRQVEKKTARPEVGDGSKKQTQTPEAGLNGLKTENKGGDQQAQVTAGQKEKPTGGPQAHEGSKQTEGPKTSTETRPAQRTADTSKPTDVQKTTERPKTSTEAPGRKQTQEAIVPGSQQVESPKTSTEIRSGQKPVEVSKTADVQKTADRPKTTTEQPVGKKTQEAIVPSQQEETPKTSTETRPGQKTVEAIKPTDVQKPGQAEQPTTITEASGDKKSQEAIHHLDSPQSRQIENPSSSLENKEKDHKESTTETSMKKDAEDRKLADERQNALEEPKEEELKEHKEPTSGEQADKDADQLEERHLETKLAEDNTSKTEIAEKQEESGRVVERDDKSAALKTNEDRDRSAIDRNDTERNKQMHAVHEAQRAERAKHDAERVQSVVRVGEAPPLPHQETGVYDAKGDHSANQPLQRFDTSVPSEGQRKHEQIGPRDNPQYKQDGTAANVIEAGLAKDVTFKSPDKAAITNIVHNSDRVRLENSPVMPNKLAEFLSDRKRPLDAEFKQELAAQIVEHAEQLGLETEPNELVLWTRLGKEGDKKAEKWARANGGTTLGMTDGGKWLDDLGLHEKGSPFSLLEANAIVDAVSQRLAVAASGQVRVLHGNIPNQSTKLSDSTYYRSEERACHGNERITGVSTVYLFTHHGDSVNLPHI